MSDAHITPTVVSLPCPRYVQAVSFQPGVWIQVSAETLEQLAQAVSAMMSGRPIVQETPPPVGDLVPLMRWGYGGIPYNDSLGEDPSGEFVSYSDLAALFDRILGRKV